MPVDIKVTASPTPADLSRRLKAFGQSLGLELVDVARESTRAIWARAQTYEAPPVPGYHRTGNMSRQTVWLKTDTGGKVEMRAEYSIWVRGSMTQDQAWMHKGRWTPFKRIVKEGTQARKAMLERLRKLRERYNI